LLGDLARDVAGQFFEHEVHETRDDHTGGHEKSAPPNQPAVPQFAAVVPLQKNAP